MGVKDLWPLLEPHAERKPISELRGKTVAIDLAGWVCESLNVVDYFVHSKHYLKNLFFRTCYLIWEDVTPVFILEGVAPILKAQVIAKRNELQFRGVKPKDKTSEQPSQNVAKCNPNKGRTRFNHVLKQCETLLKCMGIQCVQAPGEAEAYAAFLNKKNLVDGVISQDSDCFAYGAHCVYRNFSVSMQGAQAASGGAVDLYDIHSICNKMDFGQHKIIVMALLCGCDYCPDGVGGVGREAVNKLFNKYKEHEILNRIRSWRQEDSKYTALEMRVDDKNICSNCGHIGRTARHTTNGCAVCRTARGCDASLWREERLSLKAELLLRKKALAYADFPNEQIIEEFLYEPNIPSKLNVKWQQPNLVKFVKQMSHLLQWSEVYCLQKFLPLITRWQLENADLLRQSPQLACVEPKKIVKKRNIKSVLSLEIIWQDVRNCLQGLIPAEQLENYNSEHEGGITQLWTTIEPWNMIEISYPRELEVFVKSIEKPKKNKKPTKTKTQETNNKTNNRKIAQHGLIDRFLIKKNTQSMDMHSTPIKSNKLVFEQSSSTPNVGAAASPLPIILHADDDDNFGVFDMSDLVNVIVNKERINLQEHAGKKLYYESIAKDANRQQLKDDLDLMVAQKRMHAISPFTISPNTTTTTKTTGSEILALVKKTKLNISLDDSFDVLVNQKNYRLQEIMARAKHLKSPNCAYTKKTHLTNFIAEHQPQQQQQQQPSNLKIKDSTDILCDSLSLLEIE